MVYANRNDAVKQALLVFQPYQRGLIGRWADAELLDRKQ